MNKLFDKVAVFGDLHFGLKSNSSVHNQDCLDFISWFCKTAKENGCTMAIFLGDMTHQRNAINLLTLSKVIKGIELLSNSFDKVFLIPGNHDNYFKDSREAISISWANQFKNVSIINEITKIDDCIFAPWLVGDEHKFIFGYEGDYLFGHLEIPGFVVGGGSVMPNGNGMNIERFNQFGKVFTGHFHKRQSLGNISYIGNAFPHNFGDVWDDERGMMILEYGKTPEYITWPFAPKYRNVNISELVNDPSKFLVEKGYIKLILDTEITFEEAMYLKEGLMSEYSLREISLVSIKKDIYADDLAQGSNVQYQSVNDIILSQLGEIKSEFYDSSLLLSIFRGLRS
jgi:DNA repair exonuclease SbcCD nuclease subunit